MWRNRKDQAAVDCQEWEKPAPPDLALGCGAVSATPELYLMGSDSITRIERLFHSPGLILGVMLERWLLCKDLGVKLHNFCFIIILSNI